MIRSGDMWFEPNWLIEISVLSRTETRAWTTKATTETVNDWRQHLQAARLITGGLSGPTSVLPFGDAPLN
jgi:hypothetical protein